MLRERYPFHLWVIVTFSWRFAAQLWACGYELKYKHTSQACHFQSRWAGQQPATDDVFNPSKVTSFIAASSVCRLQKLSLSVFDDFFFTPWQLLTVASLVVSLKPQLLLMRHVCLDFTLPLMSFVCCIMLYTCMINSAFFLFVAV